MSSPPSHIAIIGAGLSGLTLALALRRQKIPCILYEARPASLDIGGAIMLSPNALKILDALGVYETISPLGYHFELLHFRSRDDQPVDAFEFGSASKHGYQALRIFRHDLIAVLVDMVRAAGVSVHYNRPFSRVLAETHAAVTWQFADGSTSAAKLLIGADGIHSRVRTHLHPDLSPRFTNIIGVTAAVPTPQLQAAHDYPLPVTIMSPQHGAFVIAPQRADGSEVLIGKQRRLSQEHDRAGWHELMRNKAWWVDFLRAGSADFPPLVRNAVADIPLGAINLWPFYLIPKLDSWVSRPQARVVILGDAAHAIPPTAGQGVNQAFEDVYTFAGVLSSVQKRVGGDDGAAGLGEALRRWQLGRQARVDRVLDLNERLNQRRMPDVVQDGIFEPFDLDWLYGVDFEQMVEEWAASSS